MCLMVLPSRFHFEVPPLHSSNVLGIGLALSCGALGHTGSSDAEMEEDAVIQGRDPIVERWRR